MGVAYAYSAFVLQEGVAHGEQAFFISLPTVEIAQLHVYSITLGLMDVAMVRLLRLIFERARAK
jgi:hypothetical protein